MREALVKTEEFKDSLVGRIPKDWEVTCIGDLGSWRGGSTPSKSLASNWSDGEIVWVSPKDFRGTEITDSEDKITKQALTNHNITLFEAGNVLAVFRSSILRHTFPVAIGQVPFTVNQDVKVLSPRDNVNHRFAFFVLQFLGSEILRAAAKVGTTVESIDYPTFCNLPIYLPPIKEQEGIVEIIDTLDKAIAHTSSLIAKLKQMKAGLLHDLLTRGLDENGELRDAIAHPEQFKDSPLGQVPKDWEVVPIQQAAAQVPGATTIGPFGSNLLASDYRSVGVPVTFVRDIKADGFQWNSNIYVEPKKARELSAHSVQSGDLLATKMGLPPCIACVYPEGMALGIITADIIRLRPNTQISTSQWLSLFINSNAIIRQVRGITGGITRDKITLHDFRRLLIALPSLKEQKQITNILDTYNSRICCEEAYREKLKFQKQGLMHDLLTGKVRVKNA